MSEEENNERDIYIIRPDGTTTHKKVKKNRVKTKEEISFQNKLIEEMNEITKNKEITKNHRLCPNCVELGFFNFEQPDSYDEVIDDRYIKTTCLTCGTKIILDIINMIPILINYSILDDNIYIFNPYSMVNVEPIKEFKGMDIIEAFKIFKKKK